MNKQRAAKLYELADRLSKLDVNSMSEQQRQQRNKMIAKLQEEVRTIKEFSPSEEDNDENEELYNYAKMWYNGDMSTQEDVEKELDLIGWEIGEVETEEGGAFIIKSGDENGDTYISFSPEDLSEGVAEGEQRMSRAAKGYEKYGKEGMQALAKAGREGKDLDKIRDKYNKYDDNVTEEFNGEYDDEAGMVQSNLRTMARAVNGLLDTIEDNDNLPEWAQEKIAKAEMMTTSVWDYLLSQKEQGMDPKVQGMAEAKADSTGSWVVYNGSKVVRFKTHSGAKAYAEKNGGQVASSEYYHDKIQKQGVAETKKPSPKLTPVNIKKTEAVSEEINKEAYERLQKVFAFKNYES